MDPTRILSQEFTTAAYRNMFDALIASESAGFDSIEEIKMRIRNCPCIVDGKDRICDGCVAHFLEVRNQYRVKHPTRMDHEERLRQLSLQKQAKQDKAELNKIKHMYATTASDLKTSLQETKAARAIVTKLNNILRELGHGDRCILFHVGLMEGMLSARLTRDTETQGMDPGYIASASSSASGTPGTPVSPSKRPRYVSNIDEIPTPSFVITKEYFDFSLQKCLENTKNAVEHCQEQQKASVKTAVVEAIEDKKAEEDRTIGNRLRNIDQELVRMHSLYTAFKNSFDRVLPNRMLDMSVATIRELNELTAVEKLFRLPFPFRRHPVIATREVFMDRYAVFRAASRDGELERYLGSTRSPKFVSYITANREPLGNIIEYEGDTTSFIRNSSQQAVEDSDDGEDGDQIAPEDQSYDPRLQE